MILEFFSFYIMIFLYNLWCFVLKFIPLHSLSPLYLLGVSLRRVFFDIDLHKDREEVQVYWFIADFFILKNWYYSIEKGNLDLN